MNRRAALGLLGGVAGLLALTAWWASPPAVPEPWTAAETALLRSLWIGQLGPPPPAPSNRVADDERAAALGHRLFFDVRLSAHGGIACVSCHQPGRQFTDALGTGRGVGVSGRNTRSVAGAAYSPWQYWDGRRDSLWSQALTPLEDPAEHGGSRTQIAQLMSADARYRAQYEALFGPLPVLADAARFPPAASPLAGPDARAAWHSMDPADREQVNRVFANVGKAIAAYERLIRPGAARFDAYVEAVLAGDSAAQRAAYSDDEIRGLRLFIGRARCIECHNGPLLSNHEFHNTGLLSAPGAVPDRGRIDGLERLRRDPFNCLGPYSDDPRRDCPELAFASRGAALVGAMRTPSLRTLAGTAPFGHQGQLATLAEVLAHYNRAPEAMIGHNETSPLGLGRRELRQLELFLNSLAAPFATAPRWLQSPAD